MSLPLAGSSGGFMIPDTGPWASIVAIFVLQPLAYFAFIQAFRYRVSRPIPMSFGQAFRLTAIRAGVGLLIIGLLIGIDYMLAQLPWQSEQPILIFSFLFVTAERIGVWLAVGYWGAGLRGRRLAGWTISGALINFAFDVAAFAGLMAGFIPMFVVVAVVLVFIAILHVVGRRDSLKLRFTQPVCTRCKYTLTGNLSGFCPECGEPVPATLDTAVPT